MSGYVYVVVRFSETTEEASEPMAVFSELNEARCYCEEEMKLYLNSHNIDGEVFEKKFYFLWYDSDLHVCPDMLADWVFLCVGGPPWEENGRIHVEPNEVLGIARVLMNPGVEP